jgi:hypothetical protein
MSSLTHSARDHFLTHRSRCVSSDRQLTFARVPDKGIVLRASTIWPRGVDARDRRLSVCMHSQSGTVGIQTLGIPSRIVGHPTMPRITRSPVRR